MIGFDHGLDRGVGAAARLDAVDLAAELILEPGDVGKGFQARRCHIVRDREGGLGVGQARFVHDLDLIGSHEGGDVFIHRRFPVTEEDVQALVADAGEDDLLHGAGLLAFVAQTVEQHIGHATGGDHVGPVDHAHTHGFAGGIVRGHGAGAQQRGTAED
ncbi:hypothetical protein D3C76_1100520 [compost metagenome]